MFLVPDPQSAVNFCFDFPFNDLTEIISEGWDNPNKIELFSGSAWALACLMQFLCQQTPTSIVASVKVVRNQ